MSTRRSSRSSWRPSLCNLLWERQCGNLPSNEVMENILEHTSVSRHKCRYFGLPRTTKSAISICFSPDGANFASTHGDHTVKIINFSTGVVEKTLVGHPRTPWTVKYHPFDSRYLASGCLGSQVRIWDAVSEQCISVATVRHAIISLDFHPEGDILAIASANGLYLWDYKRRQSPQVVVVGRRSLRCVRFPPDPTKVILGESNDASSTNGSLTLQLTATLSISDFDAKKFLASTGSITETIVSKSRVIFPQVLLYNDGGFDISQCGRFLAVCVDYTGLELPYQESYGSPDIGSMVGQVETMHLPEESSDQTTRRVRARLHENQRPQMLQGQPPEVEYPSWLTLLSLEAENLGQVVHMTKLQGTSAGGVTSVKMSPTGTYVMLGYGVRDRAQTRDGRIIASPCHRIITIYQWENMQIVSSLNSSRDDVNIAIFHPRPCHGFVYGAKQGRVLGVEAAFVKSDENTPDTALEYLSAPSL